MFTVTEDFRLHTSDNRAHCSINCFLQIHSYDNLVVAWKQHAVADISIFSKCEYCSLSIHIGANHIAESGEGILLPPTVLLLRLLLFFWLFVVVLLEYAESYFDLLYSTQREQVSQNI